MRKCGSAWQKSTSMKATQASDSLLAVLVINFTRTELR
jgi:hypothetical protein